MVIVSLGGKGRFRGRFGGTRTLNRAAGMRCSASVRVAVPAVLRHAERSYFYHGLLRHFSGRRESRISTSLPRVRWRQPVSCTRQCQGDPRPAPRGPDNHPPLLLKVNNETSILPKNFTSGREGSILGISRGGPVGVTILVALGAAILGISALGPPVVNGNPRVLLLWVVFFECCRQHLER